MLARVFILGLLLFADLPQETHLKARTGSVVIRPMIVPDGKGTAESQLEFLDPKGKRLCVVDYTSADANHGYAVVKAEWTRDQRFFVWSLQSSGGHSPWHYPTHVFDSKTLRVYLLDDLVPGPGISSGDFKLSGPSTIESLAYEDKHPFIMKLEVLDKLSPSGNEFHCGGGHTLNFGVPE